jgi:hypothetical protein
MKKFVITITIFSMMSMMGCSYTEQMEPDEIDFNENQDLNVVMTDTTYTLEADHYYYNNDTIFTILSKPLDESPISKFEKQIPVEEIETVEVDKFDYVATIIAPLAVVSLIFLIMASGGLLW